LFVILTYMTWNIVLQNLPLKSLYSQRRTTVAPVLYTRGQLVNQIPRQNSPMNYTSGIEFQL